MTHNLCRHEFKCGLYNHSCTTKKIVQLAPARSVADIKMGNAEVLQLLNFLQYAISVCMFGMLSALNIF